MFSKTAATFTIFVLLSTSGTSVYGQLPPIVPSCDSIQATLTAQVTSLVALAEGGISSLNATLSQTVSTAVNTALQQQQQIQNLCGSIDISQCTTANGQCVNNTVQSVANPCLDQATSVTDGLLNAVYTVGIEIKYACCPISVTNALGCATSLAKLEPAIVKATNGLAGVTTTGLSCAQAYGAQLTSKLQICTNQLITCGTAATCVLGSLGGGLGGGL